MASPPRGSYEQAALSIDQFAVEWSGLLDKMGPLLYARLRPELAFVTTWDNDAVPSFEGPVFERRLIVGWRTWFGPSYVERYGHDWLRGLPNKTADLDDGGVFHALDGSALELIQGHELYADVWRYLEQSDIEPFWPKRPRAAAARSTTLAGFGNYITSLMSFTIRLKGNRRVKVLPLGWKDLSPPETVIALQRIAISLEEELREHPDAQIELEIDELAPEIERLLLETAARAGSRLTWRVVPELAPPPREEWD
ncbi:MAG: hypothetical protein KGJ86_05820 [Chloroflexota bacterium]|nr:hypothetical protein [Chloroflexota bacterium]